ncbi:prolyl 3-hydroxylase 2 isoform X2 [Nematostella vectensis]|uniref:prolyl 3-hydroxylase 2 isoform X2 n=1 Tax=Nematostella vectensis TaxID=45351 RepID=UPI0020778E10|nr:prolyl 3-hydroxylase 2 isoform X2 [Nematostella vectensis]
MAGQLIISLSFVASLNFFVQADLLDNLNFTRTKTAQYDELYNDGLYAYNLKNYSAAVKYFEQAIADYRQQNEVKLHCRSTCAEKFRKSLGFRNVGAVLKDIELEYFRFTIFSRKCTQVCREKYLGKRAAVSPRVDEDFKFRRAYSYLHFAYYKTGQIIKGARAAYTFLETSPDDQFMLDNMKYYKSLPIVTDDLMISFEPMLHQEKYFKAVKFYEEQKFELAVEGFEETLKEYYKAYERCKLMCEEKRESNKMLGRSGLYGVYVDVLSCRAQCPIELATVKGHTVDKYLARHYNYLQMSYWKAGQTLKAAECATTYLLLDPDDDNMIDNLKYFRWYSKANGEQIQARKEVIDYYREVTLESRLLHLAVMYTDEDNMAFSDELFEDADAPDSEEDKKDKGLQIAEDLVEGEDSDYSAIRLSGLGPARSPSEIRPIQEKLKEGKYQNAVVTMTEDKLNGSNRFVADQFISEEECKTLMDLARTAKLGDGYNDRSMPDGKPFSFTEQETFEGVTPVSAAKAIMQGKVDIEPVDLYLNSSERMRDFVEDYFQLETPLYFSYSHLVCRTSLPGSKEKQHISHPVHSDNCLLHHDGPGTCPKRSPAFTWRDYSALLYLNEDFEGGEFIFTHPNETIQAAVKPKCGRMVGFSAGVENLHGVLGVEGRRCAVALWFTMRVKHDEMSRWEAKKLVRQAKEKMVGKENLQQQFAKPDIQSHAEL